MFNFLFSEEVPSEVLAEFSGLAPGADAMKKLTPSLGIPYLGV